MSERKPSVSYLVAGGLAGAGVAVSYLSVSAKMGSLQCPPLIVVALAALIGGACGSIVDELRKAYRESEKSLRLAGQEAGARKKIIGIVAHDLRNPLMNLSMKIYMLRKDVAHSDPLKKKLSVYDSMQFSIERMSRIIDDLLDATRIDNGNFTLQPTPCRVDLLLGELLPGLQELGQRSQVVLHSMISEEIREIYCDPFRVAQVLSNLIQNAIKHSPTNGTVSVTVRSSHEGILFVVSDEGNGVPASLGERIFDAYITGLSEGGITDGPATSSTGAGLGLFISRAIARCHGGELGYKNKKTAGAEFTFLLPNTPGKLTNVGPVNEPLRTKDIYPPHEKFG